MFSRKFTGGFVLNAYAWWFSFSHNFLVYFGKQRGIFVSEIVTDEFKYGFININEAVCTPATQP